jgi:hypothetical protein
MALTPKQQKLVAEIRELSAVADMNHWDIESYPAPLRTIFLEIMKNKLIRSDVIFKYAVIDELLAVLICHQFFPKPKPGETFKALWKTKKFRLFVHFILDDMYLLAKLKVVHGIKPLPKEIRDNIERINALRNGLAHSLFPENRRQYMQHGKVIYRGLDISSKQGLEKLSNDFDTIQKYLSRRAGH